MLAPTKFLVWLRYCLQGEVAKLASGLFHCWSLSCNNNLAINLQMFTSSYDIGILSHVTLERRHLGK